MANKRFEVDQGFKLGALVIDESTGDISTSGNITLTGTGQLTFAEIAGLSIAQGGTGADTQQAAITALTGTQTSGYYLRSNGTNAVLAPLATADLSGTVPVIKGGTGQTSQQAAINALVGSQTSGYYLRSDGTNTTMSPLALSDITGTVSVTQGGTGQTTASAGLTALLPTQSGNSGKFLTTNGTQASWSNSTSQPIAITNSTTSTGTSTGALTVSGGVGVTGNVHASKLVGNVSTSNITSTEAGTINITGNLVPTTDVTYDLGTPSKRFNTLYLAGNTIDLGGALITTTDISLMLTAKSGASFEITGGAGEVVSSSFANLNIVSNLASTSTTTGAVVVAGGLGVAGNVYAGAVYAGTGLTSGGETTLSGNLTLQQSFEVLNTKTGSTGTVSHDVSTGSLFYHSSISNNFTVNLTNVPTTNNRAFSATLFLSQGSAAYVANGLQINGVSQSFSWVGGVTPVGSTNALNIQTFTVLRVNSGWQVFSQVTTL